MVYRGENPREQNRNKLCFRVNKAITCRANDLKIKFTEAANPPLRYCYPNVITI